MLIDLHAHPPHPGFLEQDPFWGPFYESTPDGDLQLRIGNWKLSMGTPERRALVAAGKIVSREETLRRRGDPSIRLAQMDAAEQDMQVLSLPPPYSMYGAEAPFARRYARHVNEVLRAYCSADTRRLKFWAHTPLQDPESAAAELDHAVKNLGALGLAMGGANFGGLDVHHPEMRVVWKKCVELDVPIFVHGHIQSMFWTDKAPKEDFDTTAALGYCYDETRLFWNFICGGVLDDLPGLKIYITHGGGFIPYQIGRLHHINAVLRDGKNKRPLRDYLPHFYFDPMIHEHAMRRAQLEVIGVDNLVYGTNFGGADATRDELTAPLGLSEEDRDKIRWKNTAKLLKLDLKAGDSFVLPPEQRRAVSAAV
jgi:predicted TIM-barrel fold metal-dependent hydrolase